MRKGIIVKDGVVYSGGSGGGAGIKMTYEAYRALEEAGQVQPDMAYYLTGVPAEGACGMDSAVYEVRAAVGATEAQVAELNASKANHIVYSASEQKTGDTWTDGKPIYCTIFDYGKIGTLAGNWVKKSHGIAEIETIIRFYGHGNAAQTGEVIAAPSSDPVSLANNISVAIQKTAVAMLTGSQHIANVYDFQFFIYYTKTTDSSD